MNYGMKMSSRGMEFSSDLNMKAEVVLNGKVDVQIFDILPIIEIGATYWIWERTENIEVHLWDQSMKHN